MSNTNRRHGARSTGRAAKAQFFDEPYVDTLLRMNTELLTELWMLKDRVLVLEHLLGDRLGITSEDIDRYEPSGELAKRLDDERDNMLRRVLSSPFRDEKTRTVEGILQMENFPVNKKNDSK